MSVVNTYNDEMNESVNLNNSNDTPLILRNLKLKNKNTLPRGHLKINSVAGKFD